MSSFVFFFFFLLLGWSSKPVVMTLPDNNSSNLKGKNLKWSLMFSSKIQHDLRLHFIFRTLYLFVRIHDFYARLRSMIFFFFFQRTFGFLSWWENLNNQATLGICASLEIIRKVWRNHHCFPLVKSNRINQRCFFCDHVWFILRIWLVIKKRFYGFFL